MVRRNVVVDPAFGARLRQLRAEQGLSYRKLGDLAKVSHTFVWEMETGRKRATPEIAAVLDEALAARGTLAALAAARPPENSPDEDDRLIALARRPSRVDHGALDALRRMLAAQRRLEDTVGATALLLPVDGQMKLLLELAGDARGPIRRPTLDVAGQWAQFAGWLHATAGQPQRARTWYATALEWATEAAEPNMMATALNMRGHLAWLTNEVGPLIGLSAAAARQPASPGVRALAVQQEARGHALTGEADDADRLLDEAAELTRAAVAQPGNEPPWVYFHNPAYATLQRGLAYRYLGRYSRAVELLEGGLAATLPEVRGAEWVCVYVYQLGVAHLQAGDRDAAAAKLAELRRLAQANGSPRLAGLASRLRKRVSAVA